MATPLRSPYESAEEIPLDDSRYLLHDADTVYSANPRVGYRLSGFNANEEFNPVKGTPRQVMAREATEAAAKYLNEHGGFQPNVVGRDTTGSRNVSENPDLADYMVRNLYADPAVGFQNQSPALQQRVKDASEQAKLTMLFDQNNPVANQWRNLPERDYVNDPLPIPNRRPMSTGQALLNAIPRGVDVLQGDLFGAGHALARAVDKVPGFEGKNANTLRIMEEGVKRNEEEAALNPAKYGSYKDVKGVGDVLPFMAEKAVESLPSMLPMAAGGILGAAARGSTVLGALTAGAGRKAAEEATAKGLGTAAITGAKQAAETEARAFLGATALGAAPHLGEIEQDQMQLKNPVPVWQEASGALLNSALDTMGVTKGLEQLLGATKAKGVTDVAKQLLQTLGITASTEGFTEALQQGVVLGLRAEHDPNFNPLSNPKDLELAQRELLEAGIGGAAAGGLMGGLGRASGIIRSSINSPGVDQGAQSNPDATLVRAESPGDLGETQTSSVQSDSLSSIPSAAEGPSNPSVHPELFKAVSESSRANPQLVSNVDEANAFVDSLSGQFGIKRLDPELRMQLAMIALGHKPEITDGVIPGVKVDVMDTLVGGKPTTDKTLDNSDVLLPPVTESVMQVASGAVPSGPSNSVPTASVTAEPSLTPADLTGRTREAGAADLASELNASELPIESARAESATKVHPTSTGIGVATDGSSALSAGGVSDGHNKTQIDKEGSIVPPRPIWGSSDDVSPSNRLIDRFAEIYGDKTSHPQGAVSSVIDDLLSTKDDIITDPFGKPDFTYTKQDPVELRDYFDHLDSLLRGIESSGKGYSAKSMQLARDLLYQHYKALNRYEDSGRYARLANKEHVDANTNNGIQTPEVQELAPVGTEAQQLDARAGDEQPEAALNKYFQEVNESYPDASEALKQRMASSLRIIEESNDTDSDEYKQAVNALNQATNELDKNAPEVNPIDYANSKGDDYKLGLIHLYNESLKTLAHNRSRVQRVTDSGTPLSDDVLADIEESNRNAEEAIANVQSQFTPEELKTRHTKYRDDLWNSLSKSSLSGQDRDQISEVNEKFVESLKGKSPDQLRRIAQEKRRRADNTIGLNGGRHNRLSGAQLSEAMYAERLADELNTTSTAPIVPTDNVQGLAPDAADHGVGEGDVDTAPDKPFGELFGSHPLVINQRDKDGGRLSRVINKDIEKAERANKFIGFGSPGSSTDVYRQAAESLGAANTGDYTEDDQVFVSVNGNRNGAIAVTDPRYQAELDSAARAGVMFVTDTKEYTDGSRFNTGEKALRTELEKRGYVDQGNGEWIPGNGWMEWVNSPSVTSTPDATGNLGNVTERDGTVDSELSAESSVEDTATRSNAQGTIVDGKITLGQASTSSVSAEQQGNKEAPISAKLANIPITADGQQIPGTGQHVDRPTNQDKLSVEAASIDKVLESAKKSGRLDASDLAAVFDSHPQLLKNFHNFLQRTEPGTKPGYTKNGTPIYEKPFNVLKVLREAAKGNPEAAKVLTKMHEELKGFSAEIQALKDFADNAPMLGKSREMTDESERSDDEGADNAIGDLTIDNRYGTQNARVFDPNESTGVIYHGARTSNESLGKVRGYVADSPAIFPRLRSVSGLPEVIPDGKGNYVAGREGQTADEVRKQNKYFELVKTGDYWHVHEVTKDDVGESIAPNVIREKVRNAITNVSGNASTGKSGTAQNAKLSLTRMTPLKRKIKGEVKETSDVFIDATHLTRLGATLNRQDASKSPSLKDYFDNFATAVAVLYDQNIFADDGFTVSSIPHDLVIAYDRTVVNGVEKSTPVTYGEAFAAQRESDYTWDKYGDGAYAMFMDSPYRGATSAYDEQTGETLKVVGEEYSPDMQQDGVEREDIKASMKERDKALRQEVAQKETTEPTATYFEPSGKSYVEDGRLSKFVHDIAAKLGIKAKFHVVDESGVTGLLAHLNALQANLMDTMDLKQDVLDEVRHMRNVVLDTIGGKSMAHFRQELEQEAAHTNPGVQALAEALKFVSNKDLATEENAEKVYSILGKFEKDYRVSHAQLKDRLLALRATMKALREAKSSKIIYNDTSPIAIEREPIIFISNLDVRGKPKKLARQINEAAHELGHLIKRVAVDQLIEKAKRGDTEADAVVKAIFGSVDWNNESEALLADERFAEMTRKWSLTHAVPKNAVDRFFKDIGNVMRKLYNFAKSMFTKAEDRSQFESFERFMEAMLDRSGIVRSNMESAQKEVALAQRDNSRGYNGNLGPNERWAKDAADARFANATKRAVAPTWEAANLHKANTYVTGTAKTYADFVNDLVLSEFAPQNKKGATFHNYTPEESMQAVQKYAKRAATWSKDKPVLGTVTKTLGGIADIMKLVAPHVRAVVPVMQDIAPHWGEIGGHWVTLPGTKPLTKMWRVRIENGKITKESRDFVPIHIEIGKIRNGILKDNKSLVEIMSDVLAALPKVEGLAWMKSAQRKQVAERYEGMARDLLKFTTNQIPYSALSEEAKAVADYFKLLNDVFARSSEYSVTFNKRDAYFPLRIDKDKWNQNSRPVIEALIKYGKYPVEAAEHLFNEIARSHGIVDESLVDEAILASGLTAKHGRKFPLELQKALLDLDVYSMDIHHIVQGYTHQIIKRAVEQSRFGDYKRDTKGTYIKDDNGHFIFDPMGQINHIMDVDRATYYQNNSKGVHPEKLDWLRTKAFPALRGTLGGTIDPKLNALMDWTMLALNFIMLPLSVTSQLPDLAGIANMRGRTLLQPREMLRDVIKVARYFTDKSERESLRRAAQVIGSIEPHLVSSILAESMADEYMTPSTKRLSEAFFEATQMKRFTDFSRVLSTRFAIDALNEYADKPTAAKTLKLLQELHLSPQALAAWDRAGRPTDVNSLMQHDQIRTALAQWNDMAILRPSAGMRPVIGSDVRAKLFWHLKNYLYAFYYMQMKRAWVNMKDESNFAAAVPAISLGAFAMGLALAGYELRKLLANEIIPELVGVDGKSKDEDAGDLVWESFDRSGLMGPFSIIHDMWSAEKRGQMAISSLMGPAFSKTVDFMDKDLPDFLAANIPVVAQSAPLRSAARRELGKYLPDQLIGED